jgi:hypothetical protein
MFSRFFYADSGIIGERGHHADICRSFILELQSRPLATRVLAHADVDIKLRQELDATPFFKANPYWVTDGDPVCGWLNAYHATGQTFFHDLTRIDDVTADDLFYFPSVQAAQLLGIMLWLGNLPVERRPTVVIEFLYPSGLVVENKSYALPDLRENPNPVLLRFAAGRIPQIGLHRLRFGFVDGDGAAAYATLLGQRVHRLPSPQRAFAPPHSRKGRSPITVSVLGHQRGAKGYEMVPEIARRLFKSRPDTRMLVHNSDPKSTASVHQELHALAQVEPRLMLEERAVSIQEWGQLFERSDIMLCPYHPGYYKNGTSGIVAEAVANAIPLVLPADTTPARMAAEFGDASVAFNQTDIDSIVTAVGRVVDRYDAYAEAALAAAMLWQETQGPKNMAAAVIALAHAPD